MTDPLPDARQRNAIRDDLDSTMVVEAAAGTGKTTSMIGRMVRLIQTGRCGIETLVALTFTRKAAAEIRLRFQAALQEEARQVDGEERDRLHEALLHRERAFIGTIHAFCSLLLRERPVDAGVEIGFRELDEVEDLELRKQAWQEYVAGLLAVDAPVIRELEDLGLRISRSTGVDRDERVKELEELGLQLANLGPAFVSLSEHADVDCWPAGEVPPPDFDRLRERVREYVGHMEALNVRLPANPESDRLIPKYRRVPRVAKFLGLDRPADLMEVLDQFTSKSGVTQKWWRDLKPRAKQESERWDAFVEEMMGPRTQWREHRYGTVLRVLLPARNYYARLRRERSVLSFQDLLMCARNLLRDHADARRYFARRFTHILVDEFQDTDPLQAEILLLMTSEDLHERDWRECRPRSGSLFLVGDPKQSIYRFRRADMQTYHRVCRKLQEEGGRMVSLTSNFRTSCGLVEWVNETFSAQFPAEATDLEPSDHPLCPARDATGDGPVQGIFRLSDPNRKGTAAVRAGREAARIAAWIAAALRESWGIPRTAQEKSEGLPHHVVPGDFMIVCPVRRDLAVYARALQAQGVPYHVTGGSALNEAPEVLQLWNCLRCLARPDDRVALIAVLRGPLFGISDRALLAYRRLSRSACYSTPLPDGLAPEYGEPIQRALERLRRYADWIRSLPPIAAIERIVGDLGLSIFPAAEPDGRYRAGALAKTIEFLRASAADTVEEMMAVLEPIALGRTSMDGFSGEVSETSQVRLLNLHKAKGLEASVVFLAGVGSFQEGFRETWLIDRSGSEPRGYLSVEAPRHTLGSRTLAGGRGYQKKLPTGSLPLAQPAGWDSLREQEEAFLAAEKKRLMYVAATRAKSMLVIGRSSRGPWSFFEGALEGVPELPEVTAADAVAAEAVGASPPDSTGATFEERWGAARAATYRVVAAKEWAVKGPKPRSDAEFGTQWGAAMHGLLEGLLPAAGRGETVRDADLVDAIRSALEAQELSPTLAGSMRDQLRGVMASELWHRARRAQEVLTEVPFVVPDSRASATIVRGVLDLAFLEGDTWVIVDYKTEAVSDDDRGRLVAHYRPQVQLYADAWRQLSGEPAGEMGLLFTAGPHYVRLDGGSSS